ncbi:reverse transcriptase [Lithospermum erythrorhizon]|uniref:Reverse transcriptase n=1 Tax=Lithospermum erythrorhizon TaxID=34254 RepID=A0AAV3PHD3_LITER
MLRIELRKLNKEEFSNISSRVKEKQVELEETVLSEQGKIVVYKDGDASSSFFHNNISLHQAKNMIVHIHNNDGILIEDYDEVKRVVVDFYKHLFTEPVDTSHEKIDMSQIMHRRVQDSDKQNLSRGVSAEEVKSVMLSMKMGKALGPHGFTTEFYKNTWLSLKTQLLMLLKTSLLPPICPGSLIAPQSHSSPKSVAINTSELRLSSMLGMSVSALPIRYLGIRLTTKQLKASDYRMLIDKVRQKIDGWGSKHLSFARRPVLINSVIFGLCNYWCQTVFLPQSTIQDIEKMMKCYLWKGSHNGKYISKVSWKQATLRKEKGGLGIKDIQKWNLACMSRHVWNLCSRKDALWVRWIHTLRIKG